MPIDSRIAGIWTNPKADEFNTIILEDSCIRFARLDDESLLDLKEMGELELYDSLEEAAKQKKFKYVNLARVYSEEVGTTVKFQKIMNPLLRLFAAGHTNTDSFTCESVDDRNQLFEALEKRLDGKLLFRREEHSIGRTALTECHNPLMFCLCTWVFWLLASGYQYEGHSEHTRLRIKFVKPVMDFLGPRGVLAIGLVATLISIVMYLRRVFNPPVMLILK